MPIDYNTLNEFDLANNFTGTLPDISGAVVTRPNNMVSDQFMRSLQSDGAPNGWSRVEGPSNDGYHAYLFKTDGDVRTGGRQTPMPDKPDQGVHLFNTPLVSGGLAPSAGTPGVAVPAQPLEAPVVTKVSSGVVGFPQGEYLAAISYTTTADANGPHTLLTNFAQVTVNADNKLIEFKLLLDADRTQVKGQGLWLSNPVPLGGTPDPATMRLQAVAPNTGRTFTAKGPYNYTGRTAPTVNETAIGTPPAMINGTDYNTLGGQTQTLRQGNYVFYIVQTTEQGESLPSPAAQYPINPISHRDRPGYGIQFHPRLSPSATGYLIFHQNYNEGANPEFYQLVRTHTADVGRPFTPTENPMFFGKVDTGDVAATPGTFTGNKVSFSANYITDLLAGNLAGFTNGTEVRVSGSNLPPPLKANTSYWVINKTGSSMKLAASRGGTAINLTNTGSGQVWTYRQVDPPEQFQYISISGDPPTEDTTGIPDPTGDIDPPLPVSLGIPEAGTYLVGYTRVLGGQETAISDTVAITLSSGDVAAGMVIQMEYPPRINKIPNSLYGQTDTKGLPLNWTIKDSSNATVTATGTNNNYEKAGVFYVQTSSSLANTGRYPSLETGAGKEIALDKNRKETIAGWLEVSSRTSGTGYVEVVQLDDSLSEVGSRLTLATLSANGAIYFEKTVAASGLGADLTFHADAQFARIQWGAQDNPRQLRVKVHSLIWAPEPSVGRRYIIPQNASEEWVASTDPATPWPNTHILAIGQPPATTASVAGEITAPTPPTPPGEVDFLNYDGLADGADPSGWTVTQTGSATAGAYTSTIFGNAKTYRVQDTAGSTGLAYITKDYASTWPGGSTAVFNVPIQIDTINEEQCIIFGVYPTGATVDYTSVKLGLWVEFAGGSTFDMWAMYPSGSDPLGTFSYGTRIELQLECAGFNTSSGTAVYKLGVNGATPATVASRSFLNFSGAGFGAPKVAMGLQYNSGSTVYTIQYGRLYVGTTEGDGAPPPPANTAPALTPLVQPDWPWLDGTTLSGPSSSPVDVTVTTGNRANLAVSATFNRSSSVAAERTLAQIRTSGGTELVGLYLKTTSHDVELRKGGTLYPVASAMPTSTNYRFGIVVNGAGTSDGSVLVYRTIGTGARELIVLAQHLDFTGLQAQRATVANNTELTETNILITENGEYTYDKFGPDGSAINQGYVSLVASDVTNTDVGFVVDEYVVRPGEERTFAVFMRPEDINAGAAPFSVIAYNEFGESLNLGSAYANGTAVANASPGWYEYWLTYTAPEDYYRIRIETRGFTQGRYVFQKPLDALGNLNTTSLRAAARDDRRAVTGTFTAILNARIPSQSGTMVENSWEEERKTLTFEVETPEGDGKTFSVLASTDVFTSTNHRYLDGGRVRVKNLTNAAPLAIDTTYYVRDVTTNTFKLAATAGGSAINITSDGSGTIYGYTSVTARYQATGTEQLVADLTGTWQSDPTLVPDLEWAYAELTLEGDGIVTPRVPIGSPYTFYTTNKPVLLRDDRTPLPGGVYIGGGGHERNLYRPYNRSIFDVQELSGRAAPRALTSPVRNLWGFTLNVFNPDALDEIYSNDFLEKDWIIESPYHNIIMRVRFYEPPEEPEPMIEYEGFDEAAPFAISSMMPLVVQVGRAEVLEASTLIDES